MRSIFIFCLFPLLEAATSYTQCFEQQTRRTISNCLPLAEYKVVSLTTCMQNCIFASANGIDGESMCQSLTYNSKTHTCMIYDHNGYKVPAIIHPALDIDMYTRKLDNEECKGPPQRADEKKGGNPNFIQLGSSQIMKQHTNDITSFRTHDPITPKDNEYLSNPEVEYRLRHKKPRAFAPPPITEIDGDIKVPQLERMQSSPKKEEEESECRNGYYVVLGTEIQKGDDTEGLVQELEDVEQGDCARLCTQNTGFEGKTFDCKSLNYYPETNRCELYSIQVEPNGPGKFLANPSTIYSEKFCMPQTRMVCQTDEVFILHVQKTVRGPKLAENSADGITPCLSQCLAQRQCKAAVYDDNRKRCTLFAVDLSEQRSALVETIPGSVAIENPCVDATSPRIRASKTHVPSQKQKVERNENEEWSGCSYRIDGKMYRVRTIGDQLEVQDC